MAEQGALTNWRQKRKGQVKEQKESDQVRGTHKLESTEGGTIQEKERKQPSKGYYQSTHLLEIVEG